MKKHAVELTPRDLLFLRDARPMEASDAGLGANWPRPDQIYHALLSAFYLRWPTRQPWEGEGHRGREERRDMAFRFGALKTVGPFPRKDGKLFFPRPLDLGMKLVECTGTDLPPPLKYAFLPAAKGKASLPQWVSADTMGKYLDGQSVFKLEEKDSDLFGSDRNIGIAIDQATGTTVEHMLYQAEYLRLKDGVTLACEASCEMMLNRENRLLDAYDPAETGSERIEQIVLGGQQGMCSVEIDKYDFSLPKRSKDQSPTRFVRWTLLTPAVFNAGWKPGWISPEGRVMLPRADAAVERVSGESRDGWRRRKNATTGFGATLVAARLDKPVPFSGWKLDVAQSGNFGACPKPTVLAVPAGSCYVFECETEDEARILAATLESAPRSDLLGSQGFGVGACSYIPDPKKITD